MNKFQALSLVTALGATLVGSVPSSDARTYASARFGNSSFPADAGCFTPYGAGVTNACFVNVPWHIALPVDGGGVRHIALTARGDGPSSNVGCFATAEDSSGLNIWFSQTVYLSQFGTAQAINLDINVPSGGTLMIDCWVDFNASVNMVSW